MCTSARGSLLDAAATAEPSASTARGDAPDAAEIWKLLESVPDPETPAISIVDLGIVRDVEWRGTECVVTVTPTYSGCPATEVIAADIGRALRAAGVARCRVETRLAPAWTTDWIGPDARRRLALNTASRRRDSAWRA